MNRKTVLWSVLALFSALTWVSCGDRSFSGKPGSSGNTLELLMVTPNTVYSGHTAMIVDSLFRSPQVALPQPESKFDIVRVAPSQFDDNTMFQSHRNIMILDVNPQNSNKIYLELDKWATPQVVFRLAANSKEKLDSMLLASNERILKELYNAEYRRMEKVFSNPSNVELVNQVKQKFGITMVIPNEFIFGKEELGFLWLRKETKDFGLQLLMSETEYKDENDMTEAAILDRLDTMMKHHVPASMPDSYMATERRDDFYSRPVDLNGIEAVETRGLWRSVNDHMGGPFVCYTFRSPDGSRLLNVGGYVFSPSYRSKAFSKRDLLMQMDGICRTIKFE